MCATLSSWARHSAARYRSRNIDKSDGVMINEVEEGAKETVTARRSYKCPSSTARPFAEGATHSRSWTNPPRLIKYVPLSSLQEADGETGGRGGRRFPRAYADTYLETSISTAPRPRKRRVLRYFRFTMGEYHPPRRYRGRGSQ